MEKVNVYSIESLPMFEKMIDELLEINSDQLESFNSAKTGTLDDEIVNRAVKNYEEQKEYLVHYKTQFDLWESEATGKYKLRKVGELQVKLDKVKVQNAALLERLDYLKDKTIDSILDKSDAEIGVLSMLGLLD